MSVIANRRAEEFDRLVSAAERGDDPVTGPLLAVADALSALQQPVRPRPEFRTALRQRVVAVATVQGVGQPQESALDRARKATGTWKVQRRLSALAAGAAVVTGVAGVGVGASRSLPGQPFYGVKRTVEGMQLATTVGTEARGKRHLEFARTRLAELRALAGTQAALAPAAGAHAYAAAVESGGTRSALIAQTLRDMDNETRDGANDLFAAYRSSGDTEPLKALTTFTTTQFGDLHGLVPALPETVRPAASGSLLLLTVVTTDTLRLVGVTPGSGKTPTGPAPSSTGVPATNGGSTQPSGNGAGTTTQSGQPQPQPTQSQRQNNQVVPPPVLPTIPPVLPPLPTATPTAAPNQAPTLPDVTGLLGH